MTRPLLLDTFCGAGGCSVGYARAGFDVVGVDIVHQPHHPAHALFSGGSYEFHQGDALSFLAEHGHQFDVIHASPPCQGYMNLGAVNKSLGRSYEHVQLIAETRRLLLEVGRPYVIENVEDARADLWQPIRICGTGLDRPLRRHRLFESNVPLSGVPCAHDRYTEAKYWTGWTKGQGRYSSTVVQVYGNGGGREQWGPAMGIDWMTPDEMCEAIPPAYTEHIGRQIIAQLAEVAA
jgi:DNA (cytosine-5)-methyltransferase 1